MAAQRAVKLERMQALLAALDHPEHAFPSLLVAGTKGKGSTVAMLSACLEAAGLRTARYTSPHLVNWRERAVINAEPIPADDVVRLAKPIERAVASLPSGLGPLTTFEVGTALAFVHFARRGVDIAAVEVGTGGRLDATNLLDPLVSIVTSISYDHTATLGDTLSQIAWHKAGILRPGRPAVSAPQPDEARSVIEDEAERVGARLDEIGREWRWTPSGEDITVESTHPSFETLRTHVALLGDHQRDNATAAVAALHALGKEYPRLEVPRLAMREGLAHVEWPGRLQILSERPLLVLDGAHNAASAEVLRTAIEKNLKFAHMHLVLGLTEGKDARGVLHALVPRADRVYLTRSHHERSAAPEALEPLVGPNHVVLGDLPAALEAALSAAHENDLVLVTGSLFLVGEALEWWRHSRR